MASVPNARLFAEGGLYGFVGGAVSTVAWLAAESTGMPTTVDIPSQGVQALTWVNIVTVSVIAGLGAALVALLADGRRSARRLFTWVAVAVLLLSLVPLVTQPEGVAMSTRIVLAATHGIVYLAVVPRLASRLRAR
jgi:lysylphosphatidylglycerol synthetase-like protein (DUF2156 family)